MAESSRRVVITGVGLVTPLGNSVERVWEALCSGRSGVGKLQSISSDHLPTDYGAEAREFTGHINDFGELEGGQKRTIRKGLKMMCREIQMGVAAAQLALGNAALKPGDYDSDRTGVIYGSDYIMTVPEEFEEGIRSCLDDEAQFQFSRWPEAGLPKVNPLWLLKYLPNMPASHIAIYNDLRGPNNSITLREASPNLALAEGFSMIRRGSAERIIAGSTGTRIHCLRTIHVVLQEEIAAGQEDPAKLARPFELNRSGLVLGEGAAAVILEDLDAAEARGATILGEIVGYGSSAVVEPNGVARNDLAIENAIRQAVQRAGLRPEQLGHIHAHGLGTTRSDIQEAQAIDRVFGQLDRAVPVTAAKSYFGHLGAASGMVELIASALACRDGTLFATLNYETPDPQCPIPVAKEPTEAGDCFVNINASPQGQASSVLVRRV